MSQNSLISITQIDGQVVDINKCNHEDPKDHRVGFVAALAGLAAASTGIEIDIKDLCTREMQSTCIVDRFRMYVEATLQEMQQRELSPKDFLFEIELRAIPVKP